MIHWKNVLPGFVHDIRYEELVSDQKNQTRQLLKSCCLPWHDACLDFHKTKRRVATASASQVRQPIYKKSVRLWKQYEEELEPLVQTIHGKG